MLEQKLSHTYTPAYVIDEAKLRANLEILKRVQDDTGCRILLAQKAFSAFAFYPMIRQYLAGTTASGLYEAKLGYEEMGGEVHIFSPAYRDQDFDEIASIAGHIIFNSFRQFETYKDRCKNASIGLRVNPQCSTQGDHAIYDPCAPGSRLGITVDQFGPTLPEGVEGLHFHTLCEQNSDDLETTLNAFEEKFGRYLHQVKWLNMGGGHHITRADYDIEKLETCIRRMQDTYNLTVYLEPGEAIALNAGYLVTEVLDIVENRGCGITPVGGQSAAVSDSAADDAAIPAGVAPAAGVAASAAAVPPATLILDASAACHMPDVLEMPYRPPLRGSGLPGEKAFTYRLSSNTCLAGDVIGDYSFDREIRIGDRLIFEDMAIYSMVKNNTFNGIPLPDIDALGEDGQVRVIRRFGYSDFKERLS